MTTESARDWRVRWRLFFSEVIGTAVLVFGGVATIVMGEPVTTFALVTTLGVFLALNTSGV